MSRPGTANLKVNAALGQLPVLQYCSPEQLLIDENYQRTLESPISRTLIRKIAQFWDWGLCQPLFVARREDGKLYVVDGQHRLEAAKLRGDIWQIPCVIASFASMADEAAAFVSLNQQRRPLTQLDLFKAALAAGDFEASQIAVAIADADLSLANTTNNQTLKPGQIINVGGLRKCYRVHGIQVLTASLDVLSQAYKGQSLRYAGTIFNGIAAIVADEIARSASFATDEMFSLMTEMVGGASQSQWVADVNREMAESNFGAVKTAAEAVFRKAWAECTAELLDEAA